MRAALLIALAIPLVGAAPAGATHETRVLLVEHVLADGDLSVQSESTIAVPPGYDSYAFGVDCGSYVGAVYVYRTLPAYAAECRTHLGQGGVTGFPVAGAHTIVSSLAGEGTALLRVYGVLTAE